MCWRRVNPYVADCVISYNHFPNYYNISGIHLNCLCVWTSNNTSSFHFKEDFIYMAARESDEINRFMLSHPRELLCLFWSVRDILCHSDRTKLYLICVAFLKYKYSIKCFTEHKRKKMCVEITWYAINKH